ncbi:MAG: hypothetical protein KME17_08030 [Cyanosarcina radialis HA8281-LM2]|nr:hypothetical protein [Cyanosarcina radialis HA8281-LM2]
MKSSTFTEEITRGAAILILSEERGRAPEHPLSQGLIGQWCADLGFPPKLRSFNREQFEQLRAVNSHYARGGSRRELIQKIGRNHGNN